MADSNFRPFRSREPLAREDVDPTSDAARDPLAELARIIGQSDRVNEFGRDPRYADAKHAEPRHAAVETLDEPLPAPADRDWAADDGYAEPDAPDQFAQESYVQPRLPEPYPSDRGNARYHRDDERYERDDERAPSIAGQYSEPAEPYDDPHDDETAYDARYRDEDAQPPRSVGRQPALAPQSYDDEHEAEDRWDDRADRQTDDAEDYDDETPSRPRRSGFAVILAMLGLVLIGAGGAFAYRSMFGGAMLVPSLPPVIKANDGPNKILPNRSDAQAAAASQAGAAAPGSPEKLVSREEQPVAIQPPNAPPRVVSTIPVPPAPSAAPGAVPAGPPAAVAPALPSAPLSASPKVAAPAQPPAAPLAGSGEPKKVHTVTIRSDQVGNPNATASAAGPTPIAPAPAARPKATEAPARATAPRTGGNAPLAIVPVAQGAAPAAEPPPRSRVARTEAPSAPVATAPTAAPSAGGYSVQVTSQRSEADAQTEFKTLQAKFPGQLGNRQPIIHRADLGDKGTYYRALVGPFASSEAAGAMCSNLKAAGGSCIVQKN
ncbi:MAG TPA: SPOR domain-containing protein [Xanthobacteraceae bacterium]|nr:SPOR domain-containing protein [Xanthobacteraceae bacterium]